MLAQATPFIMSGDEFGNSQSGNNNPYCQDNIISWLDWDLLTKNKNLYQFFKFMISFRKKHNPIRKTTTESSIGFPDVSLHGVEPWQTNFEVDSHYLGVMFSGKTKDKDDTVYLAINSYWEGLSIKLPELNLGLCWRKVVDTFEEDSILSER